MAEPYTDDELDELRAHLEDTQVWIADAGVTRGLLATIDALQAERVEVQADLDRADRANTETTKDLVAMRHRLDALDVLEADPSDDLARESIALDVPVARARPAPLLLLEEAQRNLLGALKPFIALWVCSVDDADDQTVQGNGYLGEGPGGFDALCVGHVRSLVGAAIGSGVLEGSGWWAEVSALQQARTVMRSTPEEDGEMARARFRRELDIYLQGRPSEFVEAATARFRQMYDEASSAFVEQGDWNTPFDDWDDDQPNWGPRPGGDAG